jgi:hypothetical protein
MKKLFFLTSLLTILSLYSMGQKKTVRYGISGGVTFASQTFKNKSQDTKDKSDARTGFTAGVFLEYAYNKIFSFQPGISFVQKGAKGTVSGFPYETTLNYIEVPLNFLAHVKVGKKGANFMFGAGPWLGAGISGKTKATVGGEKVTDDIKFGNDDAKDDFRTFDLGGNVLAGFQDSHGFFLTGNLNFGLNNINFNEDDKRINNYYGIKVGYVFPTKK